jgi:glycine betaine/proline transport system substrate-binding protein
VSHGHEIQRSAAPHEQMFQQMQQRAVDVLVSAWLPASHGAYLAPFEHEVSKISVLYEPYCIWAVPEFVPETEVAAVSDLFRPSVLERMERLIQGINSGAGISRFSQAIISQYGLDLAGYHFKSGTEDECFGRFIKAAAEERWIVIPLWHPQWLHHRYRIRALDEPRGLLGGRDQATLIVRKDAESSIGEEALAELRRLHLGNAKVSELDDLLRSESD